MVRKSSILKTTTRALCLGAVLMAGPMCVMAEAPATDNVTVHVGGASRAAQAFLRSHSFVDLRSAIDEMVSAGNLPGFKPDTFVAQRRTLVRGWGQVLKAIEQSYDPTYDPNDRNNWPVWGLRDPQFFKDPQMRAAEAAAIAANDQKVKPMAYYHDLNSLDALAQSTLKVELNQLRRMAPDGTDADFAALDAILQQAGLSSALRTKIDAMFYARPAP